MPAGTAPSLNRSNFTADRLVEDDTVGPWHIQSFFAYRSRNQHITLAVAESLQPFELTFLGHAGAPITTRLSDEPLRFYAVALVQSADYFVNGVTEMCEDDDPTLGTRLKLFHHQI